jgi:hypothetical protein
LGSLFYRETEPYAVPLYVARGFSSVSFLHEAAMEIIRADKPAYIYQFSDFDFSGLHIVNSTESRLH